MRSVPSEVAYSRFKNHKLAPHQEELDRILAIVAEDCAAQIEEMKESGDIPEGRPRRWARYWRWTPPTFRPTPVHEGGTATLREKETARRSTRLTATARHRKDVPSAPINPAQTPTPPGATAPPRTRARKLKAARKTSSTATTPTSSPMPTTACPSTSMSVQPI